MSRHNRLKTVFNREVAGGMIIAIGVISFIGAIWYWALIDNEGAEAITAGFFTMVVLALSGASIAGKI